jgi:hypothetical protein
MKTIRTFVFVVIPVVCAACATQQPRTISALPEPQTAQDVQQLQRLPDGNYLGYQRIMANGQDRFCRQTTSDSLSGSRVVCLTEAQVRTEQLLARDQVQQLELWLDRGGGPVHVIAP